MQINILLEKNVQIALSNL